MIKTLYGIAAIAVVLAVVALLPGFTPQVAASVPVALARADRLDIRPIGRACSEQAWPNFEASCLRTAGTKGVVKEARLITTDRH